MASQTRFMQASAYFAMLFVIMFNKHSLETPSFAVSADVQASQYGAPFVSIINPKMGEVLEIPHGHQDMQLQAQFITGGDSSMKIGLNGIFLHVHADGDQVASNFFEPMDFIQLVKLEPGTHTLSVQIRRAGPTGVGFTEEDRFGIGSSLVVEANVTFDVVPKYVPLFFPPNERDLFLGLPQPQPYRGRDGAVQPIRVGVIASLKMDGQKTIWLEQFRHFPRSEYEFRFICYTASQANDGKMVDILNELDVPARLVDGLSISVELADVPDFPLNLVRLVRSNPDMRRWTIDLKPTELQFMHDFYEKFVVPLFGLDLVTFANARTEIDTLIVEAARLAGARRIVMELPNLYPPQHVHVDALVARSHFVKNHPSVAVDPTPCFVINPGIHIDSFVPHSSTLSSGNVVAKECVGHETTCSSTRDEIRPLRVGFVARLAPEKNPGLFLRMAAVLAARLAARQSLYKSDGQRRIEFVVIGDGEIRSDLEIFTDWLFEKIGLAAELGGPNPLVKFRGWVLRDDLPQLLSDIDVIVNPSLRDSETFCIANLEAMAAGVALVTFANGGQSEYMRNNTYGLVVGPRPTAAGLADGVEWLMQHPDERLAMAQRAADLVANNYTLAVNMEAYRRFYSWIMNSPDVVSTLEFRE